ncbi:MULTISPECIES: family 78 glycoside hydrolase catalytic domain [unclassified Micromonospora]|uniref:alpha-L-rhamnosidase n=1 Tax=unclassified Micromonospora TaxID=2617518 RepID=UPI00332A6073
MRPSQPGAARVGPVRFNHLDAALGITDPSPRVSWTTGAGDGWRQGAYEIVADDPLTGRSWTTGKVAAARSTFVSWPFAPLQSRDRRLVRVRVWGEHDDEPTGWGPDAVLEAGLLRPADWSASLIVADEAAPGAGDRPPWLFRREFEVGPTIESARLYASAHGVFEVEINGHRVDDSVLAPGWTSYDHRLTYVTTDVTELLRPGRNALGAAVADGWFRGPLGPFGGISEVYGDRVGLVAQLEIRLADGRTERIVTDGTWTASRGPVLRAGIYGGEWYDARLRLDGWSAPGFDDSAWQPAAVAPFEAERLVGPEGPPIRQTEVLPPAEILPTDGGQVIVDFGQNVAGTVRIRVRGDAGHTVTVRHAEVLEDGELCTRPLRDAAATDTYVLRGDEAGEEWEPRFTYHGFRYVEVRNWPGELSREDISAVVTHSDMRRTGWFECSDPSLNKLHENIVWGMRGNFVSLPTDCPQRDERLGWTGDIQVFAPAASFLFDCAGLLSSWLQDLAAEQRAVGTVPAYVPWIDFERAGKSVTPAAAWGDASVIVPWVLWQQFGDRSVLERQYASMTAWVDQIVDIAGPSRRWESGFQYGDWLDPAAPADRPAEARTDPYLVATAYLAVSADRLARAAAVLGQDRDASHYREVADRVREAFRAEYVSANGRLVSDTQTAYALALHFGLLTEEQRRRAGERLVQLVEKNDHRIGTGFVGTPIICDALSAAGAHDTAYKLLLQRSCPSWLYMVDMGATTVWERWDSMRPDGSVNTGEMTSFNHYAFGAVADWMHRTVAGLAPGSPGYGQIVVAPRPGGGLTRAAARHETPYGLASVQWLRDEASLTVDVVVPTGATALVDLPAEGWRPVEVGSGRHSFRCRYRDPAEDPV